MCDPKGYGFRAVLARNRLWFVHSGESGQQLLVETISFIVIMHPLRSAIYKRWEFEALVNFLGKPKKFLGTVWSEIGYRFLGQF